ncbi:hypothetical protein QR680_018769 [Steinernema hermaphroditum]|uniref:Uncharacterized protein n=1 Tax=Steinernema hermaphroditum TaxID=289476 RepID=A0AA39HIY6_9BILA|nr:hypothetical protein QR680_018769 [Steinernema hermaphroditum]
MKLLVFAAFLAFTAATVESAPSKEPYCVCPRELATLYGAFNNASQAAKDVLLTTRGVPCLRKDTIFTLRYVYYTLLKYINFIQLTPFYSNQHDIEPFATDCAVLKNAVEVFDQAIEKTHNANVHAHVCSCEVEVDFKPEAEYVDALLGIFTNYY